MGTLGRGRTFAARIVQTAPRFLGSVGRRLLLRRFKVKRNSRLK